MLFRSGKLNDTDLISLGITLESVFSYSSFDKSGLYDPSFLELRKDYLFRGDIYHDMTRKVTMSFFQNTKAWKNKKSQNLNFMDYLSSTSLIDTVLGSVYIRAIKEFLGSVSYVATIVFLVNGIRFLRKQFKKHTRVSNFVEDVEAATTQRYTLSTINQSLQNQEITTRNPTTFSLKYE